MENEKLFELMEKIYIELQEFKIDVTEKIDNNSDKINSLEKAVLRLEQDHGKKLEALFDGYKQNTELLNNIQKEVSKHEEVILRRIK